MATITQRIDDIDGTPDARLLMFMFDGDTYEIDLTDKYVDDMRDVLALYIVKGRKTKSQATARPETRSRSAERATRAERDAIREWGQAHGFTIPQRGKLPSALVDAYHAAA